MIYFSVIAITGSMDARGEDLIKYSGEDNRPALTRLLSSLSPWGEVGAAQSSAKITTGSLEINGAIFDNQSALALDWMPQTFSLGITGGLKFWSFTEL